MKNRSLRLVVAALMILAVVIVIIMIRLINNILPEENEKTKNSKVYRQILSVDEASEDTNIPFTTCYKNDFLVKKDEKGNTYIDCYVGNSSNNKYNNMYFELYLKGQSGDNKLLYKSGIIPCGKYIEKIELSQFEQDKGTYDAILTHYILNDKGKQLKTVSVACNIIVE